MVPKTPELLKAAHFANKFVDIVPGICSAYDELRVVFDQCISGSLMCDKRIPKVTSNLRTFLFHIETKAELTK